MLVVESCLTISKADSIHYAEVTHFVSEKYENFHAPDGTQSANKKMALTRIVLHAWGVGTIF